MTMVGEDGIGQDFGPGPREGVTDITREENITTITILKKNIGYKERRMKEKASVASPVMTATFLLLLLNKVQNPK